MPVLMLIPISILILILMLILILWEGSLSAFGNCSWHCSTSGIPAVACLSRHLHFLVRRLQPRLLLILISVPISIS
jgi:hypothetical protein